MYDEFEKYALYWVPKRDDALARFGVSWTGWCAEHGEPRARGAFPGFSFDVPAITRQVWRHGLHGTIKAPFRLGRGRSRFALEHNLGLLVEDRIAFSLPRLRLAVVDGSVALVPEQNCPALDDVVARAGDAVAALDEATSQSTAPNGVAAGKPKTVIQLPKVDTHRFRLPLTDQLGVEMAVKVKEALEPLLKAMLDQPRHLRDIALMGDPGQGRPLRVLQRYDLRDRPLREASSALPCQGPHVLVSMFSGPMAKTEIAI